MLNCVWLFVTLWTVAHQTPVSMGFSLQEYWSELPFPPPGGLPDLGIGQNGHHQKKTINSGEGMEKREPSCTVGGNVN